MGREKRTQQIYRYMHTYYTSFLVKRQDRQERRKKNYKTKFLQQHKSFETEARATRAKHVYKVIYIYVKETETKYK